MKYAVRCWTSQVPTFVVGHYVFHVAENQPAGSHVGSVSAVDRDAPPRDQFVYVIDSPLTSFQMDAESGRLSTTKALDREQYAVYQLTVSARALRNRSLVNQADSRSRAAVTIYVNDANDNRPVFTFPRPGNDTLVIAGDVIDWITKFTRPKPRVRAYDLDRGVNGIIQYSIVAGNGSRHIRVVNAL